MTERSTGLGPRAAIALAAVILVASGLRLGFLASRGWWYDEALTVAAARQDLAAVLRHVRQQEGSPPLYFVAITAWGRLFGTSEAGLRSFSALAGIATVGVAYVATARLVSVRAGIVAALIAAVNPMLVWFSLEARMYALEILLAGLSFLFFAAALERPRGRTLGAWAVASSLAVWTHYFAAFPVGIEAAWLLLRHPRRRAVRFAIAALAAAVAALLPFVHAAATSQAPWMARRNWPLRVASVVPELLVGFQPPAPLALSAVALLTPAVALWLFIARAEADERRAAAPAVVVAAIALVVPVLISLVPRLDLLLTRYLCAATVPLLVVLGAALGARRAGWMGGATLVVTCVLGVAIDLATAHVSKFEHEDWRGAARMLGAADGARALVVTPARGALPIRLYRPGARETGATHVLVREIDVIALPPIFRALGRASIPPRPASPQPPDARLRLVERANADSFTLVRYRADAPIEVERARLAAMALDDATPSVLVEAEEPSAAAAPR